jgi:poly(hydroxyalkanoate) granule-associated protein
MTDKIKVIEEVVVEESKTILSGLRRVLMAGIGVVSLAQEEAESFVNKLVERGEIAEKDGRSLIDEFVEKRKKRAEESGKRVESEIETRMESLLNRMNIPTKTDIESLTQKVTELTKKVDEIKKK